MVKTRKLAASSGDGEEEADRISLLPDEIIHHIMSFIDTEYAVRTCVLSKRWINIWKSLPFLNFNINRDVDTDDTLKEFVRRVLLIRYDCSIQTFKVSGVFRVPFALLIKNVNRWIKAAVKHNVQEVSIDLTSRYYSFTYKISPRLLNCKSLKKLTLKVLCEEPFQCADVILPKSMSLPQLKFMSLEGFLVKNVELSKRLFSSCPVLETLNIIDCDIQTDKPRNFTVESLSLRKFAYNYRWGSCHHGYRENRTLIRLSAPNLNSFTCKSDWTHDYNFQNCSQQLSHVSFNMEYIDEYENQPLNEKEVYAKKMVKLLVAADKVKRLELSSAFLEVLSSATGLVNCQLPRLCNLQLLSLKTGLTGNTLGAIACLLTISPNMNTLILKPKKFNPADIGDDWEVGFSLAGMLSPLKVVHIENVEGCDAEIKFLSFFLKYAKVLEEVALYPCPIIDSPDRVRKKFMNKLRALPRASSHIKIRWGGKKLILYSGKS